MGCFLRDDQFFITLEQGIDYVFNDRALGHQALTHKSFSNEGGTDPDAHNERLEFLGDAVLELAISDQLYRNYPDIPEGELTRLRAELVSEKGLLPVARQLDLGGGLLLGRGEEKSGGRKKPSLLTDALEALLGAVYCDGGFSAVCRVVERLFAKRMAVMAESRYGSDYKTHLQELLQGRYAVLPLYRMAHVSGPDHRRIYTMEVRFEDTLLGVGEGSSKKHAEQQAAAAALKHPLVAEPGEKGK